MPRGIVANKKQSATTKGALYLGFPTGALEVGRGEREGLTQNLRGGAQQGLFSDLLDGREVDLGSLGQSWGEGGRGVSPPVTPSSCAGTPEEQVRRKALGVEGRQGGSLEGPARDGAGTQWGSVAWGRGLCRCP